MKTLDRAVDIANHFSTPEDLAFDDVRKLVRKSAKKSERLEQALNACLGQLAEIRYCNWECSDAGTLLRLVQLKAEILDDLINEGERALDAARRK